MAGYDGYLVCVVECQVGVYKDNQVGDGFGEGKLASEEGPGMRIRVEDEDQQRRGSSCNLLVMYGRGRELVLPYLQPSVRNDQTHLLHPSS